MSATVIPASELARRREERERQRQAREALAGSILGLLDDDDQPYPPASPAPQKETSR
jgi:hypothetical protein